MSKLSIEQIKADREAGTHGPFVLKLTNEGLARIVTVGPFTVSLFDSADARRALRIPDMEDALIEAKAALDAIVQRSHDDPLGTSKVIDMRKIAEEFLERFDG